MIQLLLNKTTPHFQLLPMSKVDQSLLRIHEVPSLQLAKSQVIFTLSVSGKGSDKTAQTQLACTTHDCRGKLRPRNKHRALWIRQYGRLRRRLRMCDKYHNLVH